MIYLLQWLFDGVIISEQLVVACSKFKDQGSKKVDSGSSQWAEIGLRVNV